VLSSGRRRSPIWWMPIRIQATGIPSFQLGLHVCIQRVKGARHDHKGQIPKQHRHFCLLSVSAEQRHRGVGDIFPSLQTLRDPSIPLRNRSVRVRNIGLAGPGQLRVFLCLFPVALCPLRPAFHSHPPFLHRVNASSEIGHRDEGDGAGIGWNWARRAATGCAGRAWVWPLVLVIGRLQQQLRQPGDVKGDVIDLEIRNAPLVRHDRSSTNRKTAAATPAIIPVADYWSRYWLGSAWAGVNSGWVVSRPCMAGLTDRHAAQSVAFPVKAYASRLGLDADAYSGHSLRSGFPHVSCYARGFAVQHDGRKSAQVGRRAAGLRARR
jgi:hypothetical protein